MLAWHLLEQMANHRRGDALSAVCRGSPDIEQVRVADAVGKQSRHPYDPAVGASKRNVSRLVERTTQSRGRAAVVEVVGRQVGFRLIPVDALQRVINASGHEP